MPRLAWSCEAVRMPANSQPVETPSGAMREDALLEVRGLKKFFPIQKGLLRRVVGHIRAVDDVSFFVRPAETLSLVGESGCGKTTTARCVLRALDPTAGEVLFRAGDGSIVDVASVPRGRLRPLRREMQMIFQDPFSSLNSRMTLLEIVGEPLEVNGVANRQERTDRVAELLRLVGLRPEYMRRYPHAFSGGQRQRIGIARALALNPRLVVADEPVSALDVSVQAQILNLMVELQERLGLTYLFVAHDLSVVKHISDRVAVMYVGQMVELAETETLFANPKHPYTAALLSAIPDPDPRARRKRTRIRRSGVAPPQMDNANGQTNAKGQTNGSGLPSRGGGVLDPAGLAHADAFRRGDDLAGIGESAGGHTAPGRRERVILQGEVANPAAPPSGCYFHPRCQYAVEVCTTVKPVWEELEPGHFVRCHRSRELQLPGVVMPTES
jgi:peptide/nickel transport system ATP-binding protein